MAFDTLTTGIVDVGKLTLWFLTPLILRSFVVPIPDGRSYSHELELIPTDVGVAAYKFCNAHNRFAFVCR